MPSSPTKFSLSRNPRYLTYIYLSCAGPMQGRCFNVTLEMQKVFPELVRVPGTVRTYSGYSSDHWWLETVEGEIVDPTASQFTHSTSYFESGEIVEYHNWKGPLPVGKCANCGELVYEGESRSKCMHDECEEEFMNYLNAEAVDMPGRR